jgi:hypothetical protein
LDTSKIWVGGFAHCASISIPSSKQSKEADMIHLYVQDSQTISMYEKHAVNSLISLNLLTEKDILEPINKSRKYMLVQQLANSTFIESGRLTYEQVNASLVDIGEVLL